MERDSVDRHVERWLPELPDLDPRSEGIVTRMQYIVRYLRRNKERVLKERGLQMGEWEILHTLHTQRELGEPYRAAPTDLADAVGVPPTTMTSRLDRLEGRGFVIRVHDSADRRRLLVELTDAGHAAWLSAMAGLDRGEKELLATLGADEQDRLADLLRPLMRHVDART
ncbi:MarR family winged helix-turn-helix transcriptional regulator [Actinoallomurus sp. CA-150999]|uniref:MarR family winged helix-turn-helix transcriptional regulator n=1 Tax=Actinoallomurus sp. CA-150999 TaxID=3239887 RepID=UPI003D8FED23